MEFRYNVNLMAIWSSPIREALPNLNSPEKEPLQDKFSKELEVADGKPEVETGSKSTEKEEKLLPVGVFEIVSKQSNDQKRVYWY